MQAQAIYAERGTPKMEQEITESDLNDSDAYVEPAVVVKILPPDPPQKFEQLVLF